MHEIQHTEKKAEKDGPRLKCVYLVTVNHVVKQYWAFQFSEDKISNMCKGETTVTA